MVSVIFSNSSGEGYCPAVRAELCQNLSSPNPTCNFSNVTLAPQVEHLILFLHEAMAFIFGRLADLKAQLNDVLDLTQTVTDAAAQFDWAYWVAAGFAMALAILTLYVMIGVILSWRYPNRSFRVFSCCRSWLVFPLFIVFVILGWVFSMGFVISSLATSDFCINSPDDSVLAILEEIQAQHPTTAYYFFVYYIKGCPEELIPKEVQQRLAFLNDFLFPALFNFTATLQEQTAANLEETCGSALAPLAASTTLVNNQLCIMGESLVSL